MQMDWYRHRSSWFIIYGVILERRTCKLALATVTWSDVPYLLADHGIIRKSFFKRGNQVRGTRAYVRTCCHGFVRVCSCHGRNILGTQQHSRTRTDNQPRFEWKDASVSNSAGILWRTVQILGNITILERVLRTY